MPGELTIERAGSDQIDRLEPLFAALHTHHVRIAPRLAELPARDAADAWARRSAGYERWLSIRGAFALLAVRDGNDVGFALAAPGDGFASWESDGAIADLHDLAVLPAARGAGVGSALLDALDAELAATGITHMRLRVLSANADALRLYRRRALEPVVEVLLGPVRAPR